MIIVSQDKNNLVNFDKIEILGIDKDRMTTISCQFNDGGLDLGKYKTEERAKEVLQEIVTCYTGDGELCNQGYVVYEMPGE